MRFPGGSHDGAARRLTQPRFRVAGSALILLALLSHCAFLSSCAGARRERAAPPPVAAAPAAEDGRTAAGLRPPATPSRPATALPAPEELPPAAGPEPVHRDVEAPRPAAETEARTAADDAARLDRAIALQVFGFFDDAAATLLAMTPPRSPQAERLLGDTLQALGRDAEAVWAYVRAADGFDEIQAEDLRAHTRYLLDRMGPLKLEAMAATCPFCPEGGYAQLRVARLEAAAGEVDRAEQRLDRLVADFAGDPLAVAAATLLSELRERRLVRPGLCGLLLPLSGPLEPFGSRALRGALLGAELFREAGDPALHFAVFDTRSDPATAARGVRELAGRGVLGIVGPLKGTAAAEAARVAREEGVPLLALTPGEAISGDGVFRLYLREQDEVARLVEHAVEVRGLRRFAILYPDTPLGLRYRDLFWDAVVRFGGEITGVEAVVEGTREVGAAIQRITGVYDLSREEILRRFLDQERRRIAREQDLLQALGIDLHGLPGTAAEEGAGAGEPPPEEAAGGQPPEGAGGAEAALEAAIEVDEERLAEFKPQPIVDFEAVFLPVNNLVAAQIAPLLPFHDVEGVVLLGIRSWNYPTLTEVGEEYVDGALFAAETHPQLPSARGFALAYQTAYGEPPGVIASYAFDAARLLREYTEGYQVQSRGGLKNHLSAVWAAGGVTGPLTSHPNGDIAPDPKLMTVRRGTITPVVE